jgi:hypothetical protein
VIVRLARAVNNGQWTRVDKLVVHGVGGGGSSQRLCLKRHKKKVPISFKTQLQMLVKLLTLDLKRDNYPTAQPLSPRVASAVEHTGGTDSLTFTAKPSWRLEPVPTYIQQ